MSKLIAPTHFWFGKWWQAREQAGFPNGSLLSNGASRSRKPAGAEVKLGKRSGNTNPTPCSLCQRSVCTMVQQDFSFCLPQQAKTIWKTPALSEWSWPGDWGRLLGRGYFEVLLLLWSSPLNHHVSHTENHWLRKSVTWGTWQNRIPTSPPLQGRQ